MKALFKSFSMLALLALFFVPALVRAQDDSSDGSDDQDVSFQTFYDQLSDQGNWIQTDDYGYVWQPPVTDPDWRPYSEGHWVYSDQGWTWVSDEPWGWATYHYGRWANIDGTGWVWVPGYRWAPAWVSWRYGGGYAGWAPLPPDTLYGAEYGEGGGGFHFGGDADISFHIGAGFYSFINVGDLGDDNYHGHYMDRNRNYSIINRTTNITNININGARGGNNFQGVTVAGPPINDVNAHSRQQVQTVHLTAAGQPGRSTLQGNSLAIYAPRVNATSVHQARPTRVTQTIASPTFNRGDSITKPLQVSANVRAAAPSQEAIAAAEKAQSSAPAHAKIATAKTPIKTTFHQPLTSMQPVAQSHAATESPNVGAANSTEVHHPAEASFTGETAKPDVAQPQRESTPSEPQMYHPPSEMAQPQREEQPQHETAQPQFEQRDHTSDAAPATPHPESQAPSEERAPIEHTESVAPEREAVEPQHESAAPEHESAPSGGGGFHPASAPASHPASAPAASHSSGGGGGDKKGDNKGGPSQGH